MWRLKGPTGEMLFVDEDEDGFKNWEDETQALADEEEKKEAKKRMLLKKE